MAAATSTAAATSPHPLLQLRQVLPKDKAIERFLVSNIVEQSAVRDVQGACVYDGYTLPKLYAKMQYCVSCAIHSHVIKVCSRTDRRNIEPPQRFRHRVDFFWIIFPFNSFFIGISLNLL